MSLCIRDTNITVHENSTDDSDDELLKKITSDELGVLLSPKNTCFCVLFIVREFQVGNQ